MGLALLLGLFALGVVIGLPVAFCLGVAAVVTIAFEGLPLVIAVQRLVSGISMFSLLAIPFFIFAGELMFHGGIASHDATSNECISKFSMVIGHAIFN